MWSLDTQSRVAETAKRPSSPTFYSTHRTADVSGSRSLLQPSLDTRLQQAASAHKSFTYLQHAAHPCNIIIRDQRNS